MFRELATNRSSWCGPVGSGRISSGSVAWWSERTGVDVLPAMTVANRSEATNAAAYRSYSGPSARSGW
jgi:hypothetical protein